MGKKNILYKYWWRTTRMGKT